MAEPRQPTFFESPSQPGPRSADPARQAQRDPTPTQHTVVQPGHVPRVEWKPLVAAVGAILLIGTIVACLLWIMPLLHANEQQQDDPSEMHAPPWRQPPGPGN